MPLLLGALLGWSGAAKLRRPDGDSALIELLHDSRLVRLALRALGAVEVGLAVALLAGASAAGWTAAALGVGFVGYLAWARAVAPDASCGCSAARHTPVTGRSFGRAGLVVAGGLVAAASDRPWWSGLADRPAGSAAGLVAGLLLVGALSAELDERWLLPLRRARLRWLGHPLTGTGGAVPVAASVELLESSLAWHSAAGIVRSGLLEAWDDAGWRFLRFAGAADGRPVTVVFAVDATATVDGTDAPAVRLTVVDDERGEVRPELVPVRTLLPLTDRAVAPGNGRGAKLPT